jgi:predicted transcriptional regulator
MDDAIEKDGTDLEIIKKVTEKPGLSLSQLSRDIARPIVTVRYRIYSLERMGDLRIESDRHRLWIYPKQQNKTEVY